MASSARGCPPAGCGPHGYCDQSLGICICAPGLAGADCSTLLLGACRVHEEGEMACMTFRGLMSCACRQQCEKRFGGVARRHAPLCWDWKVSDDRPIPLNLSDLPDVPSAALAFRTPSWPPIGRCAKPNPPRHCAAGQERSMRRAANILGGWPLPNSRCPHACSRRGTCLEPTYPRPETAQERFPLGGGGDWSGWSKGSGAGARARVGKGRGKGRGGGAAAAARSGSALCICHTGYSGAGCEHVDASRCFNRCSGHGQCVGRFCLCERGWQGVDCSLAANGGFASQDKAFAGSYEDFQKEGGVRYTKAHQAGAAAVANNAPRRRPLPAVMRGTGGAGRLARFARLSLNGVPPRIPPESAYAPIYVYPLPTEMSMEGVYQRDQNRRGQYYANLMFLEQLHARRDAVGDPESAALFFVPVMVMQMAGNLWHPLDFLKKTVHYLSHSFPYWNRSAGVDHVFFLTTDRGGCWRPWALQHSLIVSYLGFRASEAYFGFEERLRWPRQGPNTRNNAYSVKPGAEALGLDCYTEGKDVVVPVDAQIGAAEEAKLPAPNAPFKCKTGPFKVLLFMGGSMTNMGRIEYSQGVRQAIQRLHINETEFVLGGKFTLDQLRWQSRFCLCPSGWGWGWRLSLAIATQCVPVIIQPNVTQPFEDLLQGTPYSYDSFSIRYTKEDIPNLPNLLRSVPDSRLCAMQAMLQRVYRAFLWQQPYGPLHASAYDLTQVLLCRRAKALAARFARAATPVGRTPSYLARHPDFQCADSLEAASIRF